MKWLKRIFLGGLVLYTLALTFLYFSQEALIFQSTTLESNYRFHFDGYQFQEVNLTADDGASINALHFQVENPKGAIVYYHGNAGDLSRWGKIVLHLVDFGYEVIVMDYRGYGKSTGKRKSEEMYSDALLVYNYAKEAFREDSITVYGRSLGSTFATYVSANNNSKQLILETPFYSLRSVAQTKFLFSPVDFLLKYRFPTYDFIEQVKCPITFFHGTDDLIVPYENGKRLFEKAPNAKLVTIEEGGHNNLVEFEMYWEELNNLLE